MLVLALFCQEGDCNAVAMAAGRVSSESAALFSLLQTQLEQIWRGAVKPYGHSGVTKRGKRSEGRILDVMCVDKGNITAKIRLRLKHYLDLGH